MTITNTSRVVTYTGNGATTVFPFTFQIPDAASLKVELVEIATGIITSLTSASYIASGLGSETGGTITYPRSGSPMSSAYRLNIYRRVPKTQETVITNQTSYYADVVMKVWDRLVMMLQDVDNDLSSALRVTTGDSVGFLPTKEARANKYLQFDANGNPTSVSSQIDARYYGAATSDPATRPDGSARQAGDAYFNTGTLAFRVFSGTAWQNAIPPASLTLTNFTETAASAKTTFTITGGYTVGTAFAYLNGVLLAPDEVTLANGTTAVLASACAIGDEFRLVAFSPISVADTLSRSSNLNDLPDKPTALTNLGFSSFVQGLRAAVDAAAFRLGLGLAFGATAAKATNTQAQVGTDDTVLMTPATVAAALAADIVGTSRLQNNAVTLAKLSTAVAGAVVQSNLIPFGTETLSSSSNSLASKDLPASARTALQDCVVRVQFTCTSSGNRGEVVVFKNGVSVLTRGTSGTNVTVDVTLAAGDSIAVGIQAQGTSGGSSGSITLSAATYRVDSRAVLFT